MGTDFDLRWMLEALLGGVGLGVIGYAVVGLVRDALEARRARRIDDYRTGLRMVARVRRGRAATAQRLAARAPVDPPRSAGAGVRPTRRAGTGPTASGVAVR